MREPIQVNYVPDGDDWSVTVRGRGQQLTGKAPGLIAARDRADQLVEKLTPDEEHRTVVHLLNGDAVAFTTAYLTARLSRSTEPAAPAAAPAEPKAAPAEPAEKAVGKVAAAVAEPAAGKVAASAAENATGTVAGSVAEAKPAKATPAKEPAPQPVKAASPKPQPQPTPTPQPRPEPAVEKEPAAELNGAGSPPA